MSFFNEIFTDSGFVASVMDKYYLLYGFVKLTKSTKRNGSFKNNY